MKSNTHIFVLRIKEIVYTLIFLLFATILILLLVFMFRNKSGVETMSHTFVENKSETSTIYKPGIYTSSIILGQYAVDVVVTVDENQIKRVELDLLDEAVATMYPLLGSSTKHINEQLALGTPLENIQGDIQNQYTLQVLMTSVRHALEKALE